MFALADPHAYAGICLIALDRVDVQAAEDTALVQRDDSVGEGLPV